MKKKTTKSRKGIGGRPTVMTKNVIDKLEECFSIGCTDQMACFQANISVDVLYKYQREHPEFIKRKEALKDNMEYLALRSLSTSLRSGDTKFAIEFLKRRKKEDWSERVEQTGKGGNAIETNINLSNFSKMTDEELQKLANKQNRDESQS